MSQGGLKDLGLMPLASRGRPEGPRFVFVRTGHLRASEPKELLLAGWEVGWDRVGWGLLGTKVIENLNQAQYATQ